MEKLWYFGVYECVYDMYNGCILCDVNLDSGVSGSTWLFKTFLTDDSRQFAINVVVILSESRNEVEAAFFT